MPDGYTIRLGVFRLERQDKPLPGEQRACIVVASTEKNARELANQDSTQAEAGYVWNDASKAGASRLGDSMIESSGVQLWGEGAFGKGAQQPGQGGLGIFRLERQDTPMDGEYNACVVVASSERDARALANQDWNDHINNGQRATTTEHVWTDGHLVAASRIGDATGGTMGVQLWSRE